MTRYEKQRLLVSIVCRCGLYDSRSVLYTGISADCVAGTGNTLCGVAADAIRDNNSLSDRDVSVCQRFIHLSGLPQIP